MLTPFFRLKFLVIYSRLYTFSREILADGETPTMLDHVLLGVRDLDEGISFMEKKSSVRAIVGGSHPGAGTRNALLSLGTERYLEIIAPDPQQNSSPSALHKGLSELASPALISWAVH